MQDEVNEKTIALYIKTGKLTAQTLQKAMKAILSKGKPHALISRRASGSWGNVAHRKRTLSGAANSATGNAHNSSIPIVG